MRTIKGFLEHHKYMYIKVKKICKRRAATIKQRLPVWLSMLKYTFWNPSRSGELHLQVSARFFLVVSIHLTKQYLQTEKSEKKFIKCVENGKWTQMWTFELKRETEKPWNRTREKKQRSRELGHEKWILDEKRNCWVNLTSLFWVAVFVQKVFRINKKSGIGKLIICYYAYTYSTRQRKISLSFRSQAIYKILTTKII